MKQVGDTIQITRVIKGNAVQAIIAYILELFSSLKSLKLRYRKMYTWEETESWQQTAKVRQESQTTEQNSLEFEHM